MGSSGYYNGFSRGVASAIRGVTVMAAPICTSASPRTGLIKVRSPNGSLIASPVGVSFTLMLGRDSIIGSRLSGTPRPKAAAIMDGRAWGISASGARPSADS